MANVFRSPDYERERGSPIPNGPTANKWEGKVGSCKWGIGTTLLFRSEEFEIGIMRRDHNSRHSSVNKLL